MQELLNTHLTGWDKLGIATMCALVGMCYWLWADIVIILRTEAMRQRLEREYEVLSIWGRCPACNEPLTAEGRCTDWACYKAWETAPANMRPIKPMHPISAAIVDEVFATEGTEHGDTTTQK